MVNPLWGFSEKGRLFSSFDEEGTGIELYEQKSIRSVLHNVLERLLGRTVRVTFCGDAILMNKRSAEAFFERNANKFAGTIQEGMTLQEKLLRLVSLPATPLRGLPISTTPLRGLPRGLLEEYAQGGVEGKKLVVGLVRQFMTLIDSLEQNHGFELTELRELIFSFPESTYLTFDRDEFFSKILEENAQRIDKLSAASGRPEVCRLASLLIGRLNDLSRKKP